jgi:hypothetical protein
VSACLILYLKFVTNEIYSEFFYFFSGCVNLYIIDITLILLANVFFTVTYFLCKSSIDINVNFNLSGFLSKRWWVELYIIRIRLIYLNSDELNRTEPTLCAAWILIYNIICNYKFNCKLSNSFCIISDAVQSVYKFD